jgi:magnesium transporter
LFALISPKAQLLVVRLLDKTLRADLLLELSVNQQKEILQYFTDEEVIAILDEIEPDDRTQIFEDLPGRLTQRLMNLLPASDIETAKALL